MFDRSPVPSAFPPSNRGPGAAWTVRRRAPVSTMPPLTQRYQVAWLDSDGASRDFVRMGPAVPLFMQAFSALARGAILQTPDGPVAVEDAVPGKLIVTDRGALPLLWKGTQMLLPGARATTRLYRIPSDALGLGRPMPDLVLGPAARLVSRRASLRAALGIEAALLPVTALTDGQTVIEITPISAVAVYHVGFAHHCLLRANGVEVESVHPGTLDPALGDDMRQLYLSMFPHLHGQSDFGHLALPRLGEDEARSVLAA